MSAVYTDKAPALIGPYSQGRIHGATLYAAGQIPIDPATGQLVAGDVVDQTRRCLMNLAAVAEAAGTELANTLKITLMLTDFSRLADVNKAYAEFFRDPFPARATVRVAGLPLDSLVEIDAIIALSEPAQ